MLRRFCLALDLVNDAALIAEYEKWHRQVWPEILDSIRSSGIQQMQIFRTGNRLCMVIEVSDDFSFDKKTKADLGNPKVQEWEELMWKFQQPLPFAIPGEKWVLMDKIFELT